MAWNDNASMYDEHLGNYRHELDKHSTNLRKIFDEIKKDDSIDINTANMIEGAIRQIKSSRKRWASGGNLPYFIKKLTNYPNNEYAYTVIPNLNFTPRIVLVSYDANTSRTDNAGKYYSNISVMLNLDTAKFRYFPSYYYDNDGVVFENSNSFSSTQYAHDWEQLKSRGYNISEFILTFNDYSATPSIKSINFWIAIE